jgi:hypothetical protein
MFTRMPHLVELVTSRPVKGVGLVPLNHLASPSRSSSFAATVNSSTRVHRAPEPFLSYPLQVLVEEYTPHAPDSPPAFLPGSLSTHTYLHVPNPSPLHTLFHARPRPRP